MGPPWPRAELTAHRPYAAFLALGVLGASRVRRAGGVGGTDGGVQGAVGKARRGRWEVGGSSAGRDSARSPLQTAGARAFARAGSAHPQYDIPARARARASLMCVDAGGAAGGGRCSARGCQFGGAVYSAARWRCRDRCSPLINYRSALLPARPPRLFIHVLNDLLILNPPPPPPFPLAAPTCDVYRPQVIPVGHMI